MKPPGHKCTVGIIWECITLPKTAKTFFFHNAYEPPFFQIFVLRFLLLQKWYWHLKKFIELLMFLFERTDSLRIGISKADIDTYKCNTSGLNAITSNFTTCWSSSDTQVDFMSWRLLQYEKLFYHVSIPRQINMARWPKTNYWGGNIVLGKIQPSERYY